MKRIKLSDQIVELSYLPGKEIAERLGTTHKYVIEVLDRKGLTLVKTPTIEDRVLELRYMPVEEIAKEVGTGVGYVRSILRKNNAIQYFTHDDYYRF